MSNEAVKQHVTTIHSCESTVALQPDGQGKERFYRTGKQVIAHCELGISIEVWFEEFQGMVAEVEAWAEQHASKIRSCYCSPNGSHVTIFVAPTSESFDFELAGELADLNSDLLRKFNIGNLEIHQIPWAEADRFINFPSSRRIYGEPRVSHSSMEA